MKISNEDSVKLYHLANHLLKKCSRSGRLTVELQSEYMEQLSDALFDIDGGVYNEKMTPTD